MRYNKFKGGSGWEDSFELILAAILAMMFSLVLNPGRQLEYLSRE